MKVKTLIFDLGDVLVKRQVSILYKRLSAASSQEVHSTLHSLSESFHLGKLSPKKFYSKLCGQIGLRLNYEDFKKVWSSHFSRNPEMEKLVKSLSSRYELFLLSNTNELHFNFIKENYPIIEIFDELILSFEAGSKKPEKRIYEEVFKRTESKPPECLFVDDKSEYVEAARKFGLKAIQFKNKEQLKKDLAKQDIKVS